MTGKSIVVKHPSFPTLAEFERVIDRVTAPGAYRAAFVEMFFAEMLGRRANCDMDGAIRSVSLDAAQFFADVYDANVRRDQTAMQQHPTSFENVAAFVSELTFNDKEMSGVIKNILSRRLDEISNLIMVRYNEISETFRFDKQKEPIRNAREWLDYIEYLRGEVGYGQLLRTKRELTILVRSYELLVASVVTPKGR
jgi:hypothetical protein